MKVLVDHYMCVPHFENIDCMYHDLRTKYVYQIQGCLCWDWHPTGYWQLGLSSQHHILVPKYFSHNNYDSKKTNFQLWWRNSFYVLYLVQNMGAISHFVQYNTLRTGLFKWLTEEYKTSTVSTFGYIGPIRGPPNFVSDCS